MIHYMDDRRRNKKSPTYPLYLGGVWMVGVRGYIGPQSLGFRVYCIHYSLSCQAKNGASGKRIQKPVIKHLPAL